MVSFKNYLKTDLYKFWNSKLIITHLIVPIIGVVSFIAYYIISPWSNIEKIFAYLQVISMAFPLIISIIITMLYEQEEGAGAFQYYLTVPEKKYKAHLSKLIVILFLGLISTIIAIMGFEFIFYFSGNTIMPMSFYVQESFIIFFSNIILYIMEYLVVFVFGKGPAIGVGIVGTLISALMITSIGDGIWFLVPFSYAMRFSSYFFKYRTIGYLDALTMRQLSIAIILSFIFLVLFIILKMILIRFFEGRKHQC